MKKALFIDRDGTLVREPADEQVDSFEKLEFMPHVFSSLALIQNKTDFDLIVVSNQDGLGTPAYPQVTFDKIQHFIEQAFRNEGITFKAWHFDSSTSKHPSANRKPAAGMLKPYLDGSYDMSHSYVIGDRETDMQLARNLGCKAYKLTEDFGWPQISDAIVAGERKAEIRRQTKETDVYVSLDLNGTGKAQISTGLGFFDHMLEQIARHGEIDLTIETKGVVGLEFCALGKDNIAKNGVADTTMAIAVGSRTQSATSADTRGTLDISSAAAGDVVDVVYNVTDYVADDKGGLFGVPHYAG